MEFSVIRNDISLMDVDAIVLPANPELREGSGTSTAIFRKAGRRELENACRGIIKRKGAIRRGTAVPTLGFNIDATYIIHAVVPVWIDGKSKEYEILSSAYYSTLKLADMMGCESLAIPLLAAGNNRFNLDLAIEIAIKSIEAYEPTHKLSDVYLVIYGMHAAEKFRKMGIPFEEMIDEAYVLGNDESYKPHRNGKKKRVKKIAKQYLDEAINQALDFIEDPDNVKQIIKAGVDIATIVIKANK